MGLKESYHIKAGFANNGDLTAVPDTDPSGFVNFNTGYTTDYERKIGSDNAAKAVERRKQNWLFNLFTENLKQWQEQGFPQWYDSITYNEGSCVRFVTYVNASGQTVTGDNKMYRGRVNNIPSGSTPSNSPTYWEIVPSVEQIIQTIPMPAGGGDPSRELVSAISGIDFNNVTTMSGSSSRYSGVWEMANDTVALSAANCPSKLAGVLECKAWTLDGNKTAALQRYMARDSSSYWRANTGAGWTSWKQVASYATTLAGYGIGDAVSTTYSRNDALNPDSSIVDSRWIPDPNSKLLPAKYDNLVVSTGAPGRFYWRFNGTATAATGSDYIGRAYLPDELAMFPIDVYTSYDVEFWSVIGNNNAGNIGIAVFWHDSRGGVVDTTAVVSSDVTPGRLVRTTKNIGYPPGPTCVYASIRYYRWAGTSGGTVTGDSYVGNAKMAVSNKGQYFPMTSPQDYNLINKPGIYDVSAAIQTGCSNRPSDDSGTLYVNVTPDGGITQQFVSTGGNAYVRATKTGTWTAWKALAGSSTSLGGYNIGDATATAWQYRASNLLNDTGLMDSRWTFGGSGAAGFSIVMETDVHLPNFPAVRMWKFTGNYTDSSGTGQIASAVLGSSTGYVSQLNGAPVANPYQVGGTSFAQRSLDMEASAYFESGCTGTIGLIVQFWDHSNNYVSGQGMTFSPAEGYNRTNQKTFRFNVPPNATLMTYYYQRSPSTTGGSVTGTCYIGGARVSWANNGERRSLSGVTDFNHVTIPGVYDLFNDSGVSAILNRPTTVGGTLYVDVSEDGGVTHLYVSYLGTVHQRGYANGQWYNWQTSYTKASIDVRGQFNAFQLDATSDLNDINYQGVFCQLNDAQAVLTKNYPVANVAGVLEVQSTSPGSAAAFQRYTCLDYTYSPGSATNRAGRIYTRNYVTGLGWSHWVLMSRNVNGYNGTATATATRPDGAPWLDGDLWLSPV